MDLGLEVILNSNFVVALSTVLTGAAAFVVYFKQKRDSKKDAANIILLEIQNAERQLKLIVENLESGILPEDVFVMPTLSWDRYKYLFVRDFDRDGWDNIADFYNKCRLYDEAVSYNNTFFQKNEEQIRVNMQRIIANYAKEELDTGQFDEERLHKKIDEFQKRYMAKQGKWMYNPNKPLLDAKRYLRGLSTNLSQTVVGIKLRKIATIKD